MMRGVDKLRNREATCETSRPPQAKCRAAQRRSPRTGTMGRIYTSWPDRSGRVSYGIFLTDGMDCWRSVVFTRYRSTSVICSRMSCGPGPSGSEKMKSEKT